MKPVNGLFGVAVRAAGGECAMTNDGVVYDVMLGAESILLNVALVKRDRAPDVLETLARDVVAQLRETPALRAAGAY